MTGHRAWQIATTTKMHFQSDSYNAFKFNFKTKQLTPEIFSRQRNMFLFEKLARRFNEDEMKTYAFVNYFFRNATWAGDLSEEPYIEFIKRTQTFSYRFKQDLNKMPDKT